MVKPKKKVAPKQPISRGLRKSIEKRGLSAYQTAKQAGVSVDAVLRFMKDQRGLTLGTADKIAESLALDICDEPDSTKDK
jgi:plasmid maintenance system antidote protein VapI